MRKASYVCAVLCAWLFVSVHGAEASNLKPYLDKLAPGLDAPRAQTTANLAWYMQDFASSQNCGKFVWGNINTQGNCVTLEYLPPRDSLDRWKRQIVITVYPIHPKGSREAHEELLTLEANMGVLIRSDAQITNSGYFDNGGEPGMLIEYALNKDAIKEDDFGILMRLDGRHAAYIELKRKPEHLTKEEKKKFVSGLGLPSLEGVIDQNQPMEQQAPVPLAQPVR
jgi:hypothetical protein